MFIKGRHAVIEFSDKSKEYFQTVTTDFKTTGVVEDDNKIAIYGQAEFVRDGEIINNVNSCGVYEFDADGKVSKVHSCCSSKKSN